MYLLNTKTLELRYFTSPRDVPFAILSHVWLEDDHKHTFQDIKTFHARCLQSSEDPLFLVTTKVRNFCNLAAEDGYEWAWLDTCCIDKSSSAELSEAINSMYAWYEAATVCYAYLYDVGDDDDPFTVEPPSQFRKSKWHERGWTLQELIASERIVFLSASWCWIGTKASLVGPLAECTSIDPEVLRWPPHKEMMSVAQRMSWAARRVTTRPEDRAYSLMGIFGVSMPVIYGEGGEKAFLRLQKEVIAICPDQSIFAWGPLHNDFEVVLGAIGRPLPNVGLSVAESRHRGLLATSPADFADSAGIEALNPDRYMRLFGRAVDYKCSFSANGVAIRLPISSDLLGTADGMVVHAAALACTSAADKDAIIFLFLTRPSSSPEPHDDISQELAFVYVGQDVHTEHSKVQSLWYYRGVTLSLPSLTLDSRLHPKSLCHRDLRITLETTRALSVGDRLRVKRLGQRVKRHFLESDGTVIEIPYWVFHRLENHYGFSPSACHSAHWTERKGYRFAFPALRSSHTDHQPISSILFTNAARSETLGIVFGVGCRCKASQGESVSAEDWWIHAFFVPAIFDHADVRDIHRLVLDNREVIMGNRSCSNPHLKDLERKKEPAVFLVPRGLGYSAEAATRRVMHVRSSLSHDVITKRFIVTLALEGFDRRVTQPTSGHTRPQGLPGDARGQLIQSHSAVRDQLHRIVGGLDVAR